MSDPNANLINQIATRLSEKPPSEQRLPESPFSLELPLTEMNVPIDLTMADAMTARQIVRGHVADAKEAVARWAPRPMPSRWTGY